MGRRFSAGPSWLVVPRGGAADSIRPRGPFGALPELQRHSPDSLGTCPGCLPVERRHGVVPPLHGPPSVPPPLGCIH